MVANPIAPIPVQTAQDPSTGQAVAVPSIVTTTRDPVENNSTTQVVEGPKLLAAEAGVKNAAEAEKEIVNAKTGIAVAHEAIQAQGADTEAEQRAKYEAERDALKVATDARIAQSMAEQKAAREAMRKEKPTTYMEDLSPIRRALTALSLGAGSYASSMTGGPNTAMQIYQSFEAADRKKKEDQLSLKAQRLADTTGDIKAAQDFYTNGMLGIQNREMARLGYFKSAIEAQMKRVPQAAVAGEEAKTLIDKSSAEKELAQQNLLAAKHTTENQGTVKTVQDTSQKAEAASNAKPTQFEQTLALHGDTMQKSIDQMRKLTPISQDGLAKAQDNESYLDAAAEENKSFGGAFKVTAGRKLGIVPRNKGEGMSENDQLYMNALDGANEGFQRVLSGANIQEKERSRLSNQLMIQPQDPPKVVQFKLDKMEREKNNFILLAGKAGQEIEARNAADKAKSDPLQPPPALQPGQIAPATDSEAVAQARKAVAQLPTPAQQRYAEQTAKQISQDAKPAAKAGRPVPEAVKALQALPVTERSAAREALNMKPSDPGYAASRRWLRAKGLAE